MTFFKYHSLYQQRLKNHTQHFNMTQQNKTDHTHVPTLSVPDNTPPSSFILDLSSTSFLMNWYSSFQDVTIHTIPGNLSIIFSFRPNIIYIHVTIRLIK